MKHFNAKGDKVAIKLEFYSFKQCESCVGAKQRRSKHTLYYYHRRLVCKDCLPERATILSYHKVPMYHVERAKVQL